eukprot:1059765-Pyramimonas_sp.AAC.1
MHATGIPSLDSAPATLEQRLARPLFINLCLLPLGPATPANEALAAGCAALLGRVAQKSSGRRP